MDETIVKNRPVVSVLCTGNSCRSQMAEGFPRHVRADVFGAADASCPRVWPGTFSRTFMPFDDPAAFVGTPDETLAEFRRVRDQIGAAMRTFTPAREPR